MIIYNLDLVRTVLGPDKAKAVLVIDSNGVLAVSIATECFQPISGGVYEAHQEKQSNRADQVFARPSSKYSAGKFSVRLLCLYR